MITFCIHWNTHKNHDCCPLAGKTTEMYHFEGKTPTCKIKSSNQPSHASNHPRNMSNQFRKENSQEHLMTFSSDMPEHISFVRYDEEDVFVWILFWIHRITDSCASSSSVGWDVIQLVLDAARQPKLIPSFLISCEQTFWQKKSNKHFTKIWQLCYNSEMEVIADHCTYIHTYNIIYKAPFEQEYTKRWKKKERRERKKHRGKERGEEKRS